MWGYLYIYFLALPFGYQFLAGAIAGVSEILVMYPLDGKVYGVFMHLFFVHLS
jgi:hypothetical protein